MTVSNRVIQELAVTAELCGTEMSDAAARVMCAELAVYPESAVLGALSKLRREHQGRFTLAAIISRLDDGRPGVEEAWAIYPKEESESAAVTTEMQLAMHSAYQLIQDGDRIAARMAFKECYERIVSKNRAERIPVVWQMTLGFDKSGREAALIDATVRGLIGADHAMSLLPHEFRERFAESVGQPGLLLAHEKGVDPEGLKRVKGIIAGLGRIDKEPEQVQSYEKTREALDNLKKLFGK